MEIIWSIHRLQVSSIRGFRFWQRICRPWGHSSAPGIVTPRSLMVASRAILAPTVRILGSIGPMMLPIRPAHSETIEPTAIVERLQTCCPPRIFLFMEKFILREFAARSLGSTWRLPQAERITCRAITTGAVPISPSPTVMQNLTDGSAVRLIILLRMWITTASTQAGTREPLVGPI